MGNKLKYVIGVIRILLGIHSTSNRTTCNLSETHWDVHDYSVNKGGDGVPSHDYNYTCHRCRKKFTI